MKALQGTWDIVSLEVEGQPMGNVGGGSQIVMQGKTFKTVSMGAEYSGTFTVDATRTPHQIDISFTEGPHAGLKSLGIFTLDRNTWRLCLGLAGSSRPLDFVTTPGSGHVLETLARSTGRIATRQTRNGTSPDLSTSPSPTRSLALSGSPALSGTPALSSSPALSGLSAAGEHAGEWQMVSLDQGGQPGVPPEYVHFGRRIVRGDEVTVTMNGQVMLKAKFVIDPSTTPPSIDYVLQAGASKGKRQLGIYEIDGTAARFCMASPGDDRPAEFITTPGDGRTLSVWKR